MKDVDRLPLTVAGISIDLHLNHKIKVVKSFEPFLSSEGDICYDVFFSETMTLPETAGTLVYTCEEYNVYKNESGEDIWFYKDAVNGQMPYAVRWTDWARRRIYIRYLKGKEKFFAESGNIFFHIGWEAILLHEQRFILHASFVRTPYGGLIFSGPSGIGKSTQADLWCRYGGGSMINGDRVILCKKDEQWFGYGSPYAGSSKCYVNECCPVKAVFLLQKAQSCELHTAKASDAFRKLFSQITVNRWNAQDVMAACSMTEAIISDVPVYMYDCTADVRAVYGLKKELMKGD